MKKCNDELIIYLVENIESEILKHRVKNLLEWYEKKAKLNKIWYYILSIISFISPLFATFISCVPVGFEEWENFIIRLFTLSSSISVGLLSILRNHEGWIRYSDALENIKTETVKYLHNREISLPEELNDIDKEFLIIIENIAQEEKNDWITTRKNDRQNKD